MTELEKEYTELKNKVQIEILKLCKVEKENFLLDQTHLILVGKYQLQVFKNFYFLKKMNRCLTLYKEGKTISEINEIVDVELKSDRVKLANYEKSIEDAKKYEKKYALLNNNDLLRIEEMFMNLCFDYHPMIKIHMSQTELQIWNILEFSYRSNNLSSLQGFYNESQLTKAIYNEKTAVEDIKYYKNILYDAKKRYNSLLETYPQNIKSFLHDDIEVAKLIAKHRNDAYRLKDDIKKYKPEYDSIFADTIIN